MFTRLFPEAAKNESLGFPLRNPWFKQSKECLWFFQDQGQGVSDRGILTHQTQIQLAHMECTDEVSFVFYERGTLQQC